MLALSMIVVTALAFRTVGLGTYGFSDDEMHKVQAVQAYRHLNFTANAEHPMLMKLAVWGSIDASEAWNRFADRHGWQRISAETALRLPNALVGAATTIVVFLVADVLFGNLVALSASALWALDVNATAINRIGKEDTFLLFFFLVAVWLYERGKQQGVADPRGAQRWFTGSGASFGLMLASKYMPHYLGVYALFNTITDLQPGPNRPHKGRFYGAMALAFVAANVAILMPATWQYGLKYVQGDMLAHHGYLYAGHLYVTDILISPLGVPVTYYLRYLAIKVPVAVLVAAGVGLVEIVRRRHERGFVLLRVLLVFVLVPYSLMAPKFLRYTLPLLAIIDLTAAVGLVAGIRWLLRKGWLLPVTQVTASIAIGVVFVGALASAQASASPFYSLFQNAVGERVAAPGVTFPEETYDYGVREAVRAIAAAAEPRAVIVSEVPDVVSQYIAGTSRSDLEARSLSGNGLPPGRRDTWVIVQDEHIYFENEPMVDHLRRTARPWREIRARDALAAQVFRVRGR